MKPLLILWLLSLPGWVAAQLDVPEWQLVVPDKPLVVGGVYVDQNQPLLLDRAGTVSELLLTDYLPFAVPDQAAIQAISFRETDDAEPVLLVVFAVAVDVYAPGEVLQCQDQQCESILNPAADLGLASNVRVDAISSVDAFGTHVSFDVGFELDGVYIDPANLYAIAFDGQNTGLTLQTSGDGLGLSEVSNLIAYDYNLDLTGFSRFYGADTVFVNDGDLVGNDQLLLVAIDSQINRQPFDLPDGVGQFLAFSSLNSGYLGFFLPTASVSESQGSMDVLVYRFGGGESAQQVVVEAANQSAINGVDFQLNPTTLTWLDGETDPKPLTVNLIDNQQMDGDKTFNLNIFVGSELTVVEPTQSTLTVTIEDDESSDLIFKDGFE